MRYIVAFLSVLATLTLVQAAPASIEGSWSGSGRSVIGFADCQLLTRFGHRLRQIFATTLAIGVHPTGDFVHAFLRAGLVPIAAWCSADAEPSHDLVAALDRDPARKGNNIGKAEKRRASTCRIFADGLGKGACPVETEDRPHCHHGITLRNAESLVWIVL